MSLALANLEPDSPLLSIEILEGQESRPLHQEVG